MSGSLRSDLFDDLLMWEQNSDLVLSLGTSMCGMNSDRIFTTCSSNAKTQNAHDLSTPGVVLGGVIVGLQCTQYDSLAALRIFSKIDDVMKLLLPLLNIHTLPSGAIPEKKSLCVSSKAIVEPHVFRIPYTDKGTRMQFDNIASVFRLNKCTTLSLTVGSKVRLVSGPYAGDTGVVDSISDDGHYMIQFNHILSKKTNVRKPFMRKLGWWWIQAAVDGTVHSIPVVNTDELLI